MQVLENFLVNIGFKVDEKGAHDAQGVFDNLSKSALQFGAIVAGKLALDKAIGDFNRLGNEVSNFQAVTGVSAQAIDQMGYAFGRVNGTAADAMATVKNLQSLMASPLTGNTGWMGEAARFGVDPTQILNAKDAQEAFLGLADQFQNLTLTQQVNAAKALGLDEAGLRLLQKGRKGVNEYYEEAKRFGLMQEGDTKIANDYAAAMQDVDRVFGDIRNTVGRELTPAITDLAHGFAEWYADNREFIQGDLASALKVVAENFKPIIAAVTILGGASAIKTLTTLLRIPGVIAAAGGAAAVTQGAAAIAGGAAARVGAGALGVAGTGAAALLYSGSLNSGEDAEIAKIHARQESGGMGPSAKVADAIKFFQGKGWTASQATGIVSNLWNESKLDFSAKGDKDANGVYQAHGIAQWHKDRRENFEKWSGKDFSQSTYQDQLEFVNYELTQGAERAAGDRLRATNDAGEAGEIVSRYYERPGSKEYQKTLEARKRAETARTFYKNNFDEAMLAADPVGASASYGVVQRSPSSASSSSSSVVNNDNKTVNININGDVEQMRQAVREEVGTMTSKTMADMQSSER